MAFGKKVCFKRSILGLSHDIIVSKAKNRLIKHLGENYLVSLYVNYSQFLKLTVIKILSTIIHKKPIIFLLIGMLI
jgi:hypothetical protein